MRALGNLRTSDRRPGTLPQLDRDAERSRRTHFTMLYETIRNICPTRQCTRRRIAPRVIARAFGGKKSRMLEDYSIESLTVRQIADLRPDGTGECGCCWWGAPHARGDNEENALKLLWCWRCKTEVSMLDDEEYAIVYKLYSDILRSIKLAKPGVSPASDDVVHERFAPVREAYFLITGVREEKTHVFLHHALSSFGPPCRSCGKPLRTPAAKLCAACGALA